MLVLYQIRYIASHENFYSEEFFCKVSVISLQYRVYRTNVYMLLLIVSVLVLFRIQFL